MAPSVDLQTATHNFVNGKNVINGGSTKSQHSSPLRKTGALDSAFEFDEVTPAIGREYPTTNIVDDLLNASNADELVRDLAITSKPPFELTLLPLDQCTPYVHKFKFKMLTVAACTVSERGVVFFRSQSNLTNALQKIFIQKLGELSGKPDTSTLHIHPVLNDSSEFGVGDHEISTISSVQRKKLFSGEVSKNRHYDSAQWHSDIQFEPYPADYTSLRLTQLPSTGGDTLWASGYDIYDYFSPAYQKFFDGLSATFVGDGFIKAAKEGRTTLYTDPRGSPDNIGAELSAVHPVVRTNPVTGWKSIYALGNFPKVINELTEAEGQELIKKFTDVILRNHEIQVRFKWKNENDIGKLDWWSQ